MRQYLLCVVLLAVVSTANAAKPKKDEDPLYDKVYRICQDAGLDVSITSVQLHIMHVRNQFKEVSEKYKLDLKKDLKKLYDLFLVIPNTNIRGPDFDKAVNQYRKIYEILDRKFGKTKDILFFDSETFILFFLQNHKEQQILEKQTKKILGVEYFDLLTKFTEVYQYLLGLPNPVNPRLKIEKLLKLLSKGDRDGAQALYEEIKKIIPSKHPK